MLSAFAIIAEIMSVERRGAGGYRKLQMKPVFVLEDHDVDDIL